MSMSIVGHRWTSDDVVTCPTCSGDVLLEQWDISHVQEAALHHWAEGDPLYPNPPVTDGEKREAVWDYLADVLGVVVSLIASDYDPDATECDRCGADITYDDGWE